MLDAAEIICPEIRTKFEDVPLSRRNIVHRIDAISHNLSEQLTEMSKSFQLYSLALDESTDLQDSAQIVIFIRGIDAEFNITEEMLSIESLKDTTTGEELYGAVINYLERNGLPLNTLASITTDGAPALVGKKVGLIKRINDKVKEDHPQPTVLSLHCIIHRGSLCKSILDFKHVIKPVVKVINLIRARVLNHRQFTNLLDDLDCQYSDVLYHKCTLVEPWEGVEESVGTEA